MHPQSHAVPIDWRRPIWIALLVIASIAFSLGFACATPFAAFAAAAALTMNRRDAMLLVGLVWLANQGVKMACCIIPGRRIVYRLGHRSRHCRIAFGIGRRIWREALYRP